MSDKFLVETNVLVYAHGRPSQIPDLHGSPAKTFAAALSLFARVTRSTDMMGSVAMAWEGGLVGLESEVAQLRRGDLDALSALIARYQNRLYRYLLRMVRQTPDAEDLFQQTWVRVAERIRQYDPQRNFDGWLFSVARNLAIDHLRRVRPDSLDEPISSDIEGETKASRLVSKERPAVEGILERERAGQLEAAMDELPVSYREVLTLRFEEEMKLEEIAQVLEIPLSTVKTRLRRSLERMRHTIETRYPN
jgi:RNA polymerase sigma-70 factor (ECF subfamily)